MVDNPIVVNTNKTLRDTFAVFRAKGIFYNAWEDREVVEAKYNNSTLTQTQAWKDQKSHGRLVHFAEGGIIDLIIATPCYTKTGVLLFKLEDSHGSPHFVVVNTNDSLEDTFRTYQKKAYLQRTPDFWEHRMVGEAFWRDRSINRRLDMTDTWKNQMHKGQPIVKYGDTIHLALAKKGYESTEYGSQGSG